jgi:hypothetical protein
MEFEMTGVEMGDGGPDPLTPDEPPTKDELNQGARLLLQKAQVYALVTCLPVGLSALNMMHAINNGAAPLSMFFVCAGVLSAGGFATLALYSAVKSIHYKIAAQFSA